MSTSFAIDSFFRFSPACLALLLSLLNSVHRLSAASDLRLNSHLSPKSPSLIPPPTMASSTGHRRGGSIDPLSDPDVYYGEEDTTSRLKHRRRAFSSVSRVRSQDPEAQLTPQRVSSS